jgi:ABC-type transport system involved in multi-copper enzyme maturation permease subunit
VGVSLRRIRLVAGYSIPAILRNGSGISYVFVTMILGVLITEPLLTFYESGILPIDETLEFLRSSVNVLLATISLKGALGDLVEQEQAGQLVDAGRWVAYLLTDRPAFLSAVFVLQMICIPLFIASGAFNQLSGDLQHGAIRYQLLRVSRTELFLGRFIGMALFTLVLMSVLLLAVVIYIGMRLDLYEWGPLLSWGGRGILLFGVMTLPYVAFCSLVSANVRSPFGSLILTSVAISGVPVLALNARSAWEPLGKLLYLMPWGFQHRLFHPEVGQSLLAVAGCLLYTVVFLAIGIVLFRRRDL